MTKLDQWYFLFHTLQLTIINSTSESIWLFSLCLNLEQDRTETGKWKIQFKYLSGWWFYLLLLICFSEEGKWWFSFVRLFGGLIHIDAGRDWQTDRISKLELHFYAWISIQYFSWNRKITFVYQEDNFYEVRYYKISLNKVWCFLCGLSSGGWVFI